MIKNFEPRLYQETILSTAANYNTLVVLPTGLGKTNIFLMLASQRLQQYPDSKILFIGPTRPLIGQYYDVFLKHFEIDEKEMAVFTGHVKPEKRAELWKSSKVIFSTPQGLENDIINNKIDLSEVSLLGIDEAHRATGDYSYVWIAKQYNKKANKSRILGLTASPGSDLEKISEVCQNLFIEEIEVRSDDDPDVKPYIKDVKIDWVKVDLPLEFKDVQKFLNDCYKSKLREIKNYGYLNDAQVQYASKREILSLQAHLQGEIARGERNFDILKSVSLAAEAMKVQHGLELLESQGINALNLYMQKIMDQSRTSKVKATQNLVRDINFRSALIKTNTLVEKGVEHPKISELRKLVMDEVKGDKDTKMIIFTQYRDTAVKIQKELTGIGVDSRVFVGQTKKGDTGLSQKEQLQMLDDFRNGEFNVLVSSSVGEEGLDIPAVDIVLFYEPVPSAIRTIQRKGRTGRQEKGRVIILMTKATRDEGYRWSAHHKEKRMHRTLKTLKQKLGSTLKRNQHTMTKFISDNENVVVYADYREKGSGTIKELIELGVSVKLESLKVGDYLCSSRVGVEFKIMEDFVNSIIDGRLLEQIKSMKSNFERSVVVVEGDQDIYSIRNVHPNAIRGMLATIAVSYGIPVLYTKNPKETAALLAAIAKREQVEGKGEYSMHGDRKPLSLKEQQEYVVSSLPSIGPGLAKDLLKEFGSVKKIVDASEEELQKVDKLGKKKASGIRDVVDTEY